MKIYLFLILSFISLAGKSQGNDSIVYLLYDPETCPACKYIIKQVSVQLQNKLSLVLKESYLDFKTIVEEDIGSSPINLVFSDSIYSKLLNDNKAFQGVEPVLMIYNKNMELIGQQKINSKLSEIKYPTKPLPQRLKLPENTKVTCDNKDWIFVSNIDRFSIIQWVNKSDSSDFSFLKLYDSIEASNIIQTLAQTKPEVKEDYTLFTGWSKKIQKMFPSFLTCQAVSMHQDTVWFVLSVLAFKKTGNDKFAQDRNVFIVKFYNRKFIEAKPVNDVIDMKHGCLHVYNNFYIESPSHIFFTSYRLDEKYKPYSLIMEYISNGKRFAFKGYKNYKLNSKFKDILNENRNIGNYYIQDNVLFYSYLNEIYDIALDKTIKFTTVYPYVDSIVLNQPNNQIPVWQFCCAKYNQFYYSFVKLKGKYYIIKYNHVGQELSKILVDLDFGLQNEPKLSYYKGHFLILDIRKKTVTSISLQ
ncbi:MAG: hypothetical protein K1X81_10305 [Bacteroidia bacterium]|nr:hypothetical protein [Bacteroidia bacterium]